MTSPNPPVLAAATDLLAAILDDDQAHIDQITGRHDTADLVGALLVVTKSALVELGGEDGARQWIRRYQAALAHSHEPEWFGIDPMEHRDNT